MTSVFILITVQCVLGAFDNLWHHELQARLPSQPGARRELALHSARELIYGLLFVGIAWWQWQGAWAWMLVALLSIELLVTLWDFIEEDRSRALPASERVLHTLLAINVGAILAAGAPVVMAWSRLPTDLVAIDHGAGSALLTLFGVGVTAWGLRDLFAVARLGVPQWHREPLRAGRNPLPKLVLVTGATGFVGSALVRALVERGDRVIALSRQAERARDQFGPHVEVIDDLARIEATRRLDAVVNLAGEPLAGGPWTAVRKRRFVSSRVDMAAKVGALVARLAAPPEVLVNASAIGFYGERGDETVDEGSDAGRGFLADLCCAWESAATSAARRGVRLVRLRIGLVLGVGGGVLQPLAFAARLSAAAVLGDGRQWQSWIHRGDLVRLLLHAIDRSSMRGAVNAVSPGAVTQRDFVDALARCVNRLRWLRVPAFILRSGLGGLSELFLCGQRVTPMAAPAQDFTFRHPTLDGALRDLLRPPLPADTAPVAVYVNDACPVCHAEMDTCRVDARQARRGITFCPVDARFDGLAAYGLHADDLRRRLFVYTADGHLRSGMDALRALWADLPRRRHLARIASLPLLRTLLDAAYDLVLAPALDAWNRRRGAYSPVSNAA